jgi:hypothetical protein
VATVAARLRAGRRADGRGLTPAVASAARVARRLSALDDS